MAEGDYTIVPPIIFDATQHYLDPESVKRTACGINFTDKDWTTDDAAEHHHICWQCFIVGDLHDEVKQLRKVVDAAYEWKEDPESGPLRGRLSEALAAYEEWSNPDFEIE